MLPGLFHPPNLETALVMGIRPIEADHGAPAAAMRTRDDRAMVRPQRVGSPAGLKHRFVHGPPAVGRPRLPYLHIIDPLEGFMRTQNQARHIPTDMIKALSPAKHVPIRSQTTADRLRHTNKRHHGGRPASGGATCSAWPGAWRKQPSPALAWGHVHTCPPPPDDTERASQIFYTT